MPEIKVWVWVMITKNNKVLLWLRKGAHGEDTRAFPGWHLEFGESWEECAKRETMEEIGVKLYNITNIIVTNDIFVKEHKHYVTPIMKGEIKEEPKLMEPHKCKKWEWFDWDKMPDNLFVSLQNLKNSGYNPFTK